MTLAMPAEAAGFPSLTHEAAIAAQTLPPQRSFAPGSERLNHLFRAALKDGRIHPLYMPLLKYRLARAAPCTR